MYRCDCGGRYEGMTQGQCKPSGHFTGHGLPSLPRSATGLESFRPIIDVDDDHHQGPFRGVCGC
jgi:hypothetical protein